MQGSNGENREVNRLHKGQYFGELGLISKKPRAASVFAVGTVKCAGLSFCSLHFGKSRGHLGNDFTIVLANILKS